MRDGVGADVLEICAQLPDGRKALEVRLLQPLFDDEEIRGWIRQVQEVTARLRGRALRVVR